jgi:HK97 family phage portal protein
MGLGRLFETRSTRYTVADTITGATTTFTVIDGLSPSWASSSAYRGAMTIPAGWRGAVLLSSLLGEVPWHAYRSLGSSPEEKIDPIPPLLDQPHPPDTRMTTFVGWGLDYIWNGNAVGVWAARNAYGWPTAVVPVPAEFVSVRRVTPFMDSPLPVGELEYAIGSMRLGSDEVLHIKGPCAPGAVRGMGLLESQFKTINLAQQQIDQASSLAVSGVPTGLITTDDPDIDETGLALLKEQWLANQATRTVQALSAAVKFQPLSWKPEEAQMIEARKFTLTDWENMFGLPLGWLGGSTSSRTYANIEQDDINLLKFTLQDKVSQFEQTLSLAFPRGTQVRANLDAVLRTDTLSRYQAHAIAITAGFLTKDEVRELEHRPPLPKQPEPPPPAPPVQATATVGAAQPAPVNGNRPMAAVGAGPAAP